MITIGSHIQTNKQYKDKMYEPLYHEEVLDGLVLKNNKDNIVTYKLLKYTCNFSKNFNYHMNKWRTNSIHRIGIKWVEDKYHLVEIN